MDLFLEYREGEGLRRDKAMALLLQFVDKWPAHLSYVEDVSVVSSHCRFGRFILTICQWATGPNSSKKASDSDLSKGKEQSGHNPISLGDALAHGKVLTFEKDVIDVTTPSLPSSSSPASFHTPKSTFSVSPLLPPISLIENENEQTKPVTQVLMRLDEAEVERVRESTFFGMSAPVSDALEQEVTCLFCLIPR